VRRKFLAFALWNFRVGVCGYMPLASRIPWCLILHGAVQPPGDIPEEWWDRFGWKKP
jgi:hypothetical protein